MSDILAGEGVSVIYRGCLGVSLGLSWHHALMLAIASRCSAKMSVQHMCPAFSIIKDHT